MNRPYGDVNILLPDTRCCDPQPRVPDDRCVIARDTCWRCKTRWVWDRDTGWVPATVADQGRETAGG